MKLLYITPENARIEIRDVYDTHSAERTRHVWVQNAEGVLIARILYHGTLRNTLNIARMIAYEI
jgi:hypothetical protein